MCWRKGCLDIEDRRTVYYFDRLDVNGLFFYFFFFQAEDGIRDGRVTWSSDVCSSDLPSFASDPESADLSPVIHKGILRWCAPVPEIQNAPRGTSESCQKPGCKTGEAG